MPEKYYKVLLDETCYVFTYIETIHGIVSSFVVKLVCVIDDGECEILRYDSGHNIPHLDILSPDGTVKKKLWLHHLDNAQALTQAQEDIEQNYVYYKERYEQWKREEEKK